MLSVNNITCFLIDVFFVVVFCKKAPLYIRSFQNTIRSQSVQTSVPVAFTIFPRFNCPRWVMVYTTQGDMTQKVMFCYKPKCTVRISDVSSNRLGLSFFHSVDYNFISFGINEPILVTLKIKYTTASL